MSNFILNNPRNVDERNLVQRNPFGSLNLPREILVEIFSWCAYPVLICEICLVSKSFKNFVRSVDILWRIVLRNEFGHESDLFPYQENTSAYQKFEQYVKSLGLPKDIEPEIVNITNEGSSFIFDIFDEYGQGLLLKEKLISHLVFPFSFEGSLIRYLIFGEYSNREEIQHELDQLRLILNHSAIDSTVPLSIQFDPILKLFKTGEYTIEFKRISETLPNKTNYFTSNEYEEIEDDGESYRMLSPPKYLPMILKNDRSIISTSDLFSRNNEEELGVHTKWPRREIVFFPTQDITEPNSERIEYYEEMIRKKKHFPILLLIEIRDTYYVLDGHHKFIAYSRVDKYPIHAVVIKHKSKRKTIGEFVGAVNHLPYSRFCYDFIKFDSLKCKIDSNDDKDEICEKENSILEKYCSRSSNDSLQDFGGKYLSERKKLRRSVFSFQRM